MLGRGHLFPCCAGVVTLVTTALPPASQTGICTVMTQPRHVSVRDVVAVLVVIARGFIALPGVVPR
jgi:hypothetical protein